MTTRVRLTKQRIRALQQEVSLNDVMYEQYRRMHEEIQREWRKVYQAKTVISVIKVEGKVRRQMKILGREWTKDGTQVIVE